MYQSHLPNQKLGHEVHACVYLFINRIQSKLAIQMGINVLSHMLNI